MLDQLEAASMKPHEIAADTTYSGGANIVACAQRGVELVAPVRDPNAPARKDALATPVEQLSTERQAAPTSAAMGNVMFLLSLLATGGPEADLCAPGGRLSLGLFSFDSTCHEVQACPAGHAPSTQHMAGAQLIATFPAATCAGCPLAAFCPTRTLADGQRLLQRAPASIATELRQMEQRQPPFKESYRLRSGIEPTNWELKHPHGLARLRIRGKESVRLAVLLKALALNVKRAVHHHLRKLMLPPEPTPECQPA
jgi:hypothetical protein